MHSSTRHASRTPKPPTASYQWSSEYVSPGHPDKIADQISDAVLDAYLRVDAHARVACETMVKNNVVILAGEVSAMVMLPEEVIETVVRDTIRSIGYRGVSDVFDADTCIVHQYITQQSPEIAAAVQKTDGEGRSTEIAAGDQGIMFGYATRETPTFMPMAIYLAKAFITHAYEVVRQEYPLFPDMKAQVGLTYENGKARRIDSIVFSTCHDPRMSIDDIRAMFNERLLPAVIDAQPHHIRKLFKRDVELLINPAGTWTVGGPVADCGLTGRKIVVDHYGADCEIGGGAFSGKDPTKVDRSAAYMARYLALQALHQHDHVSAVKVQLAYAIGEHLPTSLRIYDSATGEPLSVRGFGRGDLTPSRIIHVLGLRAPIYQRTARYGHFGIEPATINGHRHHAWESTQPLDPAPACIRCRYSFWSVGLGQGFFCKNHMKISEGGDSVRGEGFNARFMIPSRGYSCEHYELGEGKRAREV